MASSIQPRNQALRRTLIAVAVALAVLVGLPGGASAAESSGWDTLTPQQETSFIQGAKSTMGLTDEQIDLLLADATAWKYVATSATVGVDVTDTGVSAAAVPCKTVSAKAEWKDRLGNVLWRFTSRQYFCWNGSRVGNGSGSPPPPPTTTQYTNGVAALAGWDYDGITVATQRSYYLNGNPRGGFHSIREAKWKYCPVRLPLCLPAQYPNIQIWVHYNGTWDQRVRIHT
jgi:hypothetical protein